MTLKIYLLRHGETETSQQGNFCGTLDIDLTPAGYQMAEDFANTYKELPWAAVFSSPLKRALATAEIICQRRGIAIEIKIGRAHV